MFSYAYSIVGMDTLFMNIMNCVAGNVTIIQESFLTLRERCVNCSNMVVLTHDNLYENEVLMSSMNIEMKKIIKHLQITFR